MKYDSPNQYSHEHATIGWPIFKWREKGDVIRYHAKEKPGINNK
jgi:hypothetical protein